MHQPETVALLRALARQFGDLAELATGKAQGLPDTSFAHYRKLGEAAGLHTAWRMVADLADQVADGQRVTPIHTFKPKDVDSIDNPGKGIRLANTPATLGESQDVHEMNTLGARAGAGEPVIPTDTFTRPIVVDSSDNRCKGVRDTHTFGGPRMVSAAASLRDLQIDLGKLADRALSKRSKAPKAEQPRHQAAADAYQAAWRRVAELAQRFEDRERAGQ